MADTRARIIAHFSVKPEHASEFVQEIRVGLVSPTLKEPGCLQYDLWQDVRDPTRFAMVEVWESDEALERHLALPSLREAVGRLTAMAAERPRIQRFRALTGAGAQDPPGRGDR
jgi:quinol monooxygenase YgiN